MPNDAPAFTTIPIMPDRPFSPSTAPASAPPIMVSCAAIALREHKKYLARPAFYDTLESELNIKLRKKK
jgi:hypothetical protein